ncbi:unnamed protein product [Closterium sp. NIES-65]|nr:unnamed protein product [Closterium sp. NIES-65]
MLVGIDSHASAQKLCLDSSQPQTPKDQLQICRQYNNESCCTNARNVKIAENLLKYSTAMGNNPGAKNCLRALERVLCAYCKNERNVKVAHSNAMGNIPGAKNCLRALELVLCAVSAAHVVWAGNAWVRMEKDMGSPCRECCCVDAPLAVSAARVECKQYCLGRWRHGSHAQQPLSTSLFSLSLFSLFLPLSLPPLPSSTLPTLPHQECDPYASQVYRRDHTGRYADVPYLCTAQSNRDPVETQPFCSTVWDVCGMVGMPYNPFVATNDPRFISLYDVYLTKGEFCRRFMPPNKNPGDGPKICYRGKPVDYPDELGQDLLPPVNNMCVEQIGLSTKNDKSEENSYYVAMTPHPDQSRRAFFLERAGRLFLYNLPEPGSSDQLPSDGGSPFLDISGLVAQGGEQGAVGIAFHPDYTSNGRLFVSFTCDSSVNPDCKAAVCGCYKAVNCSEENVQAANPDGRWGTGGMCRNVTVVAEFSACSDTICTPAKISQPEAMWGTGDLSRNVTVLAEFPQSRQCWLSSHSSFPTVVAEFPQFLQWWLSSHSSYSGGYCPYSSLHAVTRSARPTTTPARSASGRTACSTSCWGTDPLWREPPCSYPRLFPSHSHPSSAASPSTHPSVPPPQQASISATVVRYIVRLGQPFINNNGGQIRFGADGMLYVMVGDGGGELDPLGLAQNPKAFHGKVLRLDVLNGISQPGEDDIRSRELLGAYGIPPDNPHALDWDWRGEVFALGFHDPWKCTFDLLRPSVMMCGDVGWTKWEEVDVVTSGGNYGWKWFEGREYANASEQRPVPNQKLPSFQYVWSNTSSVVGGFYARGYEDACLYGRYLFSDRNNQFYVATENPPYSGYFPLGSQPLNVSCAPTSPIQCPMQGSYRPNFGAVFAWGQDVNGTLYILTHLGVFRLTSPTDCNFTCRQKFPPGPDPRVDPASDLTVLTTGYREGKKKDEAFLEFQMADMQQPLQGEGDEDAFYDEEGNYIGPDGDEDEVYDPNAVHDDDGTGTYYNEDGDEMGHHGDGDTVVDDGATEYGPRSVHSGYGGEGGYAESEVGSEYPGQGHGGYQGGGVRGDGMSDVQSEYTAQDDWTDGGSYYDRR